MISIYQRELRYLTFDRTIAYVCLLFAVSLKFSDAAVNIPFVQYSRAWQLTSKKSFPWMIMLAPKWRHSSIFMSGVTWGMTTVTAMLRLWPWYANASAWLPALADITPPAFCSFNTRANSALNFSLFPPARKYYWDTGCTAVIFHFSIKLHFTTHDIDTVFLSVCPSRCGIKGKGSWFV